MTLNKTIAVLDANVLYPAPVRDILLNFADAKLFQPKWTKTIQEEWTVICYPIDQTSPNKPSHEQLRQ